MASYCLLVEDGLLVGGFVADIVSRSRLYHFTQRLFNAALGLMLGFAEPAGVVELAEQVAGVELAFSVGIIGGLC